MDSNNLELEVLKNKQDIALVTMAMGKVDDNLSTMVSTLKEVSQAIIEIRIAMAAIESLEKRVVKLETDMDGVKDVPNKILFRVGTALLAFVSVGALTAYFKGA